MSKISQASLKIPKFAMKYARGIAAIIGIILILFGATLPAISFVFDNEYQKTSTDLMWNGDLVNSESSSIILSYEEAQKTWYPFLTGPLTPNLIIYLAIIIAVIGLFLRLASIWKENQEYEKRARFSIQAAVAMFWVALGLLIVYFLGMQSSSRGIDLFESIGAVLVVIGSITLIPITSPYEFKAKRRKK